MKKSFKILLLAEACANIADVFFKVAIISHMYLITQSVISSTIIPIIFGSAGFISSFFLPLVTKKYKLNQVLFFSQLTKTIALTCLLLLTVILDNQITFFIYGLVTIIAFMDGFAGPTSLALIPRYATDLIKANSLLSALNETVEVVGWAIGGMLLISLGITQMIVLTLVLFWIASLMAFLLPTVNKEMVKNETTLQSIFKGWQRIFSNTQLKIILGINLFEILANTIWVSSIILAFITIVLRQDETYWGYINTTHSIGIILGGWGILKFSNHLKYHKSFWIFMSLVLTAIVFSLSLIFIDPIIFLISSVCIGFLSQLKEIPEATIIQESVEEEALVNVYSAIDVVSSLAFSICLVLMSSLTEWIQVQNVFWVAVALILIEAMIVFKVRKQLN
ncbi:MFS transporter [Staphylococcus cornubiensis]|uniref:MFS transporter n=1 Tax=Staphylococcus cornubiensis TaxID=1986155 RepID=UPI000A3830D8|nr:MFS transporter [Staphylococcus cornubiensis]